MAGQYLQNHPIFSQDAQSALGLQGYEVSRNVARKSVMLLHGDEANYLWFVVDGWVKLFRETPQGHETVIALCVNDDCFGEAALFPGATYPYSVEAITDVKLVGIPAAILQSQVKSQPQFAQRIMEHLNERMTQQQLQLEHVQSMSAAQRIGCFLLRLCRQAKSDCATIDLPIEKHVIATYLAMKPETFSRGLKQLQEVNVRADGTQVHVASVEALQEYVCDNCSESGACESGAAAL